MATIGLAVGAAALAESAVALAIAGYLAASRRDVVATTEVAAPVIIAAGLPAGTGRMAFAATRERAMKRF